MTQQLIGQAADVWLESSTAGVERFLLPEPDLTPVEAPRAGVVQDVWLGPLARLVARRSGLRVGVAVRLGQSVKTTTPVLFVGGEDQGLPRWLSQTVRIRRRRGEDPESALSAALEQLHQQAMGAARAGDELEWRAISESYEQVLLALPEAASTRGVPFEGAVAAPGFFGRGPVQQIASFIYDELVAAVDSNSRELIGPITYFPQRIATAATELGAPALAGPMLGVFPAMYLLARRGL